MTAPRSVLVSLEDTPWYHVYSRVVRRAWLCGEDAFSGKNFDHRRGWIAERIAQLAAIFAIDMAAYAILSSHYHIVLRVDRDRALDWSTEEVLRRWTQLFTGPFLVQRYLSDARSDMTDAELRKVEELAALYRTRLHDLSWFMRTLNEFIARKANAEDGVTGRFWEGRFKSQALLDEQALLAAMAYVDLNPIRAGMAETPETSDYTSIQERLQTLPEKQATENNASQPKAPADASAQALEGETLQPEPKVASIPRAPLMPFDAAAQTPWAIPFAFDDYLELVDWTGRACVPGKRGQVPPGQPKILEHLGIDGERFIAYSERFLTAFGSAVGAPAALTDLCTRRQTKYLRGMHAARRLFLAKQAA